MAKTCLSNLILAIALVCIASYSIVFIGENIYSTPRATVNRPRHRGDTLKHVSVQKDRKRINIKPLIHSVGIRDHTSFVLFSHGFVKGKIIHCTVNGIKTPGKRIFTEAFQCEKPKNISIKDVLSVETPAGKVLTSIAKWEDHYGLKDLGYSNLSLCIVTMVKNEEERIEEWIQYHLRQKVDIFIIYDNNCSDGTVSILQKYQQVIVMDWPWHKTQLEAFLHGTL